jgi:hypothetical protein
MNEELNSENITSDNYLYDLMMSYADIYFRDLAVDTKQIAKIIGDVDFDISKWTIKYKKNLKACGECHLKRKCILINPEQANSEVKLTVLHEMIHAFNSMLFDKYDKYKEFFLIYFYNKLMKKIGKKKLHRIINLYLDWDLTVKDHSLLFLLKSLELDLRMNKPLGTVMAYGRHDIFHYYQNKKPEWIPK